MRILTAAMFMSITFLITFGANATAWDPNECEKDLKKEIFPGGSHRHESYAAKICYGYSKEQIAKGKQLFSAGYGANFSKLMKEIKNRSDSEIECGKTKFDQLSEKKKQRASFKIPKDCADKKN